MSTVAGNGAEDQAIAVREKLEGLMERTGGKDFLHRREWGEINFAAIEQWLAEARKTWKDLAGTELLLMGQANVQTLESLLQGVEQYVEQIEKFSIGEGQARNERDSIATGLIESQAQLMNHVAPWIGFLMYRQGDISGKLEEVRRASTEAQATLNEKVKEMEGEQAAHRERMEKDAALVEKLKEEVRQTAQELGVGTFTEDFANQAEESAKTSRRWLWATFVLATSAVGVILATGMAAFSAVEVKWEVMAAAAGGTGLLVYITSWCGRMYKVTKHQELTNRHRALSLKTVQAFAAAAQSSDAKEAVLLGAAKCIFEGRSTGLTTEKAELPTTTTQIIETTRRAVQGSGQ